MKRIYFNDDDQRLDYLINEVLEDIAHFSKEYEVAVFIKDKYYLEDYEHIEEAAKYPDEVAIKMKLIELLIMLYTFKTKTRLGSVLRAYRMTKGLTIDQVANGSDISYPTYQKWELGERNPKAKELFQVLRFLEIDIKYIDDALKDQADIKKGS